MTTARLEGRGITPLAVVGPARLDHWRISFNKQSQKRPDRGFANIQPCWNDSVYGVVFGIREGDVRLLDRFEGYPKHYQKTMVRVRWCNDPTVQYDCLAYVASPRMVRSGLTVSPDYADHVRSGINEHLSGIHEAVPYIDRLYGLMS